MKRTRYEYEIVLRVTHHEPPNPDEPSLNIMPVAWALAAHAETLMVVKGELTAEVKSAQLVTVLT